MNDEYSLQNRLTGKMIARGKKNFVEMYIRDGEDGDYFFRGPDIFSIITKEKGKLTRLDNPTFLYQTNKTLAVGSHEEIIDLIETVLPLGDYIVENRNVKLPILITDDTIFPTWFEEELINPSPDLPLNHPLIERKPETEVKREEFPVRRRRRGS